MKDQRSKDAIIAAELYADNKISRKELEITRTNAWNGWYATYTANASNYYATLIHKLAKSIYKLTKLHRSTYSCRHP